MNDPTPAPPRREGFRLALADALLRLKTAERTAAELRKTLVEKHSPEDVEAALVWLTQRGLLSDDRAAEAVVRPRTAGRRAEGDARLRQRLEARGVDSEAVERALAEAPDEAGRVQDALRAKFRPEVGQRAKAGRFLLSRGFDEDAIDGVLDRFFGEADTPEEG